MIEWSDVVQVLHCGYQNGHDNFVMEEKQLQSVDEENDLAVIISHNLKPNSQVAAAVKRLIK